MSNTQHNVGASASEGAEAVSYPLPDWGPELEHSEKALSRLKEINGTIRARILH